MIQPTYVTFEQAKVLKEKGFDLACNEYYLEDGIDYSYPKAENWNLKVDTISRPEQWLVVEWLRLKYQIHILVVPFYSYDILLGYVWNTGGLITMSNMNAVLKRSGEHNTPQEAYSAAFDYVLKELI